MNDPLDDQLSAHFKARKTAPLPARDFSARVLAALPPAKAIQVQPQPRALSLLERLLAWDTALLTVGAVIAVALYVSSGRSAHGLDVLNRTVDSLENWPAFSSLVVVLGLTVASAYLFNDDEEDEAI